MPENKNSFIKSKMNKDLDDRLLPNNEYRDAENVAVSRSEGSDVGALEAILGNKQINVTGASGNKIIGQYTDESNGYIYYFVTDFDGGLTDRAASSNLCEIIRYNTSTNNPKTLVRGSFLNLSKQFPIYGINLVESLLFWTDNKNQPRKINVDSAVTFDADSSTPYYTNEDQISVAKYAPWNAPEYINLRSTLTPLPGTMSNAADPETTTIGSLDWTENNLNVSTYQNGDEIPHVENATDWDAKNTAQEGCWCYYDNDFNNSATYGKLYNKWAVLDSRGLAPIGFSIPTEAQWDTMISGLSDAGTQLKGIPTWKTSGGVPGNNSTGFAAVASGERDPGATFANIGEQATYWTSDDSDDDYYKLEYDSASATKVTAPGSNPKLAGRSVRCIKNAGYRGWQGDPEFLVDKFVKFSYRFKFDDNEYSLIAPFSQDVFIPQQEGRFLTVLDTDGNVISSDEDAEFRTTVVEFMQNNINNAILNIELPSTDILEDYKIKRLEIIFKESDGLAYQVLESIPVDASFKSSLTNTNVYQYNYQSTIPFKTLPEDENTRVFDKVPVRSLAQESSGNRIIYGNLTEGYSAPTALDYYVSIGEKSAQQATEYPNHSIKQNRNYQVGIILADKYGRQTDVILSSYDGKLDASGDPQPGSNIYNNYKNVAFANNVEGWNGDNLKLNFNNTIPEQINFSAISGYPGAYASGTYYTVAAANAASAYFEDLSSQDVGYVAPTGDIFTFSFSGLEYDDANDVENTYDFFVNNGDGWKNGFSYSITEGTDNEVELTYDQSDTDNVTLTSSSKVRFQIYYGNSSTPGLNKRFKSKIININPCDPIPGTGCVSSMTTGADAPYQVGRYMRGKYKDYTEITAVSAITGTYPNESFTVETKDQLADTYFFKANGTTDRPEPELPTTGGTWATYSINPNGWYTYRVAIKQQEQEYYNVYLPGIVSGYPIDSNTDEQGEIGFITLIADNINKVPRNLQEVGPLDDQFNSDVRMYGRVTNTLYNASNNPGNQQFIPSSNSDKVELIGTIADVFPGIDAGSSAGEINQYCIYDYLSKPYIAKFTTQKPIGLDEDAYEAPVSPSPYPDDMNLAVYETKPVISRLELYWETSTAGLVSDLNYSVQNESGAITGLSSITVSFNEGLASGSDITNDFFPTAGGQNVTDTTATLQSVFSKDTGGNLNVNETSKFTLNNGSQTGSFKVTTNGVFYASEDNANTGYFEFTIQFTQSDGTAATQSFNTTLENINPIINSYSQPTPTLGSATIFTNGTGPTGVNGSADACQRYLFPSASGAGWTLTGLTIDGTSQTVGSYFTINTQGSNSTADCLTDDPATSNYGFGMTTTGGYTLVASSVYVVTATLTDALGAAVSTDITFTGPSDRYDGQMINSSFDVCVGNPKPNATGNTTGSALVLQSSGGNDCTGAMATTNPIWIGTFQNWTTDAVTLFVRVGKVFGAGSSTISVEFQNARAGTTSAFGEYMDQDAPPVDSTGGAPVAPSFTGTGPTYVGWSNYRKLAYLEAFSNAANVVNAGIKPGQKSPGTGTPYDYTNCAITNAYITIPEANGSGYQINVIATKGSLSDDIASIPSANLVSMSSVTYTNPPMYGDGETPTTTSSSGETGPEL